MPPIQNIKFPLFSFFHLQIKENSSPLSHSSHKLVPEFAYAWFPLSFFILPKSFHSLSPEQVAHRGVVAASVDLKGKWGRF